jgi:hypothetical protein
MRDGPGGWTAGIRLPTGLADSNFLRVGLLFSYYEYVGDELEADWAAMARDEVTQRWWHLTDPCQQLVATAGEGLLPPDAPVPG